MAMHTATVILGIDVSKAWIDVCRYGEERVEHLENTKPAIDGLLKQYPAAALAVEATNTYHELLIERARRRGLPVYLINGYQLKHYGDSLGQRMRTDVVDARLLARFLSREIADLKPYVPRCPQQVLLRRLLRRRALLVNQQTQLRQSFQGISGFKASLSSLLRRTEAFIILIEKRLNELARELGWLKDLARLRSIPGIGPLTALAMMEAYHAGQFTHRDPFIAFLGLDVRTKDSGSSKGRRRLTKQGNPEARRLLYNAALATAKTGRYFNPIYLALQARGMAKIQALVVISRKLAKLAFAILKNQTDFNPEIHLKACSST
jgi:transposase